MGNMTFLAGYMAVSDLDGDKSDAGQVSGFTVGAAFKSGMNNFKLQYTSAESDVSNTASALTAIGVDHSLSKMTKVYVMYAGISNDSGAAAGFGGTGHDSTVAAVAGKDASGFSLGMIHKF
jgi:predicted porin